LFGGTSARSGAGIWIPNNPDIGEAGVQDSPEDAFSYMRSVIPTEHTDDETLQHYIDQAPQMLQFMQENSEVRYRPAPGYADYYPDVEGWKSGGRTMDPLPLDGRKLGDTLYKMVEVHKASRAMGIFSMSILEGMQILASAPGWQRIMAGIILRYLTDIPGRLKGKRDRRLSQGNALIGGLYMACMERGVELKLSQGVESLIQDGDRIGGVVTGGKSIKATKGVLLAAGGFDHNQAMRDEYMPKPNKAVWSAGVETNTGDMIRAGQDIGADTGLMNEAWWAPSIKTPEGVTILFSEKSKPGMIIVDKQGQRFMNESITYNSYGECFYGAKERGHDCFPAFVIFNKFYRDNYVFAGMPQAAFSPDFMNKDMVGKDDSVLFKADSLSEIAGKLGIDAAGLEATVQQMDAFAERGEDSDFGRGGDAHDAMFGDVTVTPNPCLGKMSGGPYYACAVNPGDIGTKGGLRVNLDGQVLDTQGQPIAGLYAAGNCSVSIMGNKYPGAGCTIGPGMTRAYVAAQHMLAS
jgi:3-oxosteroid 1-dehydrogenase